MEISAQICINNIYHLAKEKGIKMGDLERDAKVSAGYFSRVSKKDGIVFPQIETLVRIAEILNVSIDALLKIDFSSVPPELEDLFSFIDKLITEVDENKHLKWEKLPLESITTKNLPGRLNRIVFSQKTREINSSNNTCFPNIEVMYDAIITYTSLFDKTSYRLIDDIFYYYLNKDTTVYLFSYYNENKAKRGIDIVFESNDSLVPVASANESTPNLYYKFKELFTSAYVSSRRVVIDKRAYNIISDYLNK